VTAGDRCEAACARSRAAAFGPVRMAACARSREKTRRRPRAALPTACGEVARASGGAGRQGAAGAGRRRPQAWAALVQGGEVPARWPKAWAALAQGGGGSGECGRVRCAAAAAALAQGCAAALAQGSAECAVRRRWPKAGECAVRRRL
jgi:hypothetical protein